MRGAFMGRLFPTLGMTAAIALAASACGGTTSPGSTPTNTPGTTAKPGAPSSTSTTSAATSAATKAITSTWTMFFGYSTPEATRISLLQNGSKYASIIAAATSSFPKGTSATVQKVQSTGTTATVTYTLADSSGVLESGASGMAVEVGGKWLVSDATFCGLASLAGATNCPT